MIGMKSYAIIELCLCNFSGHLNGVLLIILFFQCQINQQIKGTHISILLAVDGNFLLLRQQKEFLEISSLF